MATDLDLETPLPILFHAPAMFRAALELGILIAVDPSTYAGAGWHRGVRTQALIIEPAHTIMARFNRAPELFVLIEKIRAAAGAGKVMRAFISDLEAGGRIDTHADDMPYEGRRRFHAVLTTNSRALFTVGDFTWHMAAGRVYEIDPTCEHSVTNAGIRRRTHLVIDCRSRADG